jgi:hypothetical protein
LDEKEGTLLYDRAVLGMPSHFTSEHFGPRIAELPNVLRDPTQKWHSPFEELTRGATDLLGDAMGIDASVGTLEPGHIVDSLFIMATLLAIPNALGLSRPYTCRERVWGRVVSHRQSPMHS